MPGDIERARWLRDEIEYARTGLPQNMEQIHREMRRRIERPWPKWRGFYD